MIVLTETTDKIQVVLGGAITTNQLQCIASYRDITTTTYSPQRNITNTNNTTDVDLVGSPAASTQRVIDYIRVFNKDTAPSNVTIKFDANGTEYILFKATLATGESVEYAEGYGFKVLATSGSIKTILAQGSNPVVTGMNSVTLNADVINNNATLNTIADVTGLSFPVTSGTRYWFRFVINYTAAATTTGSRWTINGPTTTELRFRSQYSLTTTSDTFNTLVAYDTPAAASASSAATAGNVAIIEGFINPSANGTVIARFASEIANSAITAKAGSVVYYTAL